MPNPRWHASRVAWLVALFLAAAVLPAFGASLQVLVDADNNAATGCAASTPSGTMSGIEQRFVTTVNTTVNPPQVTGVTREDCDAATGVFGAPVVVSGGGWNVGVGDGAGGSNVIETSLPIPAGARVLRLGFAYGDAAIGSDALFGGSGGAPILFGLPPSVPDPIPALSASMLALLAALVAGVGYGYLRRRGIPVVPLAIVALSLVATLAWAAVVLDGLVGDWTGIAPLATDPQGDAPDGSDLVAVFVQAAPPTLYVRADVWTGLPPAAVADSYSANVASTLNVAAAGGLLANDTPGVPAGTVASYGGGSLGGAVTDHPAGTTTPFGAGGSLSVNADGSLALTLPAGFTGHFTFDYRLSNLNGTSDALVDVAPLQAPAITSANGATFKVGTAGTFSVTTTGTPSGASMVISETGALPAGVSFVNNNDGTATLAGTPSASGTFPITINAANGITPNASQSFTLTVNAAPAITSANNATFSLNQAGTFTVTTTGLPTNASMAITETGALPAG
ncbi:MAG TPA: Ig-like domain-containing protein, partial [Usitatibacter sp.]|nr:Ig-like domain-containing protein [Usitatibacter sp.]